MKLIKTIIISLLMIAFPALTKAQVSIIPEVKDQFKSNYSCTKIMQDFEQLFEFGNFEGSNIKYKDSKISDNARFSCATKNLHNYIVDKNHTLKCPQSDDYEQTSSVVKAAEDEINKAEILKNEAQQELNQNPSPQEENKLKSTIATQNNIIATQNQKILQNTVFTEDDILGCSIITGRIKFNYLPQFIRYSLELLTILGGVVSLLFVILGGYWYLINGISGGDTDKGKTYITNALIGLALSTSAWAIVNLVQIFFSS